MAREFFEATLIMYLTLWLAFVPRSTFLSFNGKGDYSYGIYIMAFPIQQTLYSLLSMENPITLFVLSMLLTTPLAVVSWHFVEKPSINMRQDAIMFLQRQLNLKIA